MNLWPQQTIASVGKVITGSTPSTKDESFYGGEIPFVTPAELDQIEPVTTASRTLSESGGDEVRLIPEDAVMVCCIGSLGKVGIAGRTVATNQQINSIVFDPARIWPRFGFHACRMLKQRLITMAPATTVAIVSKSKFEQLEIPMPPLTDQRRIAAILDKAEDLRTKRHASITKLDSLVHSLFLEMFGDPRKNEKQWPTRKIETFISDMRGGASLEPEDFVDEGFPILHKGAIKPNGLISVDAKKKTFAPLEFANTHTRSQVDRGYVAVTLRDLVPAGPSIGLAADLRKAAFDKYLLAQGAYAFRLDPLDVLPDYFVWLSNMPNFRHVLRQNAVGSTQIHIRTPIYLAIQIPIPPIKLQRAFAQSIEEVERIKCGQLASMVRLDGLIASLQHRAFRGEL